MDSFLIPMLTTLGYSLPELLACGIALAMLWTTARPGKARQLGLIGVGLMLVCAVLQLALGFYQQWMLHSQTDPAISLNRMFTLLSSVRLLVNCVSLTGLVLVAWGLCKATRQVEATVRTAPGP